MPLHNAPDPVHGKDYVAYIKKHSAKFGKFLNHRVVTKELKVFKKVESSAGVPAIANLILPTGTVFRCELDRTHIQSLRKCRASMAYVDSIYTVRPGLSSYPTPHLKLAEGYPILHRNERDRNDDLFIYTVGRVVIPDKYSFSHKECEAGIHFFFNVADAIAW